MTKTFDPSEPAGYVVGQLDCLRAEPGAIELRPRAADLSDSVVTFALQHHARDAELARAHETIHTA